MKPSKELNDEIIGVLARACILYGIAIYAYAFLSNHYHMLLRAANAKALADFMKHVNRNIGDCVRRRTGWTGSLWDSRYDMAVVADEEAQIKRLRYILAQGTKEGLVSHPYLWPGASSTPCLVEGISARGIWVDRSSDRRAGGRVDHLELELAVLPALANLSDDERRTFVHELANSLAVEASEERARSGSRAVLGVAGVLATDPFERPAAPKFGKSTLVHATSRESAERFLADRKAYLEHRCSLRAEVDDFVEKREDAPAGHVLLSIRCDPRNEEAMPTSDAPPRRGPARAAREPPTGETASRARGLAGDRRTVELSG